MSYQIPLKNGVCKPFEERESAVVERVRSEREFLRFFQKNGEKGCPRTKNTVLRITESRRAAARTFRHALCRKVFPKKERCFFLLFLRCFGNVGSCSSAFCTPLAFSAQTDTLRVGMWKTVASDRARQKYD